MRKSTPFGRALARKREAQRAQQVHDTLLAMVKNGYSEYPVDSHVY